jgi:hypothetical protein
VSPYVELILVILLPTALGYGLIALWRGLNWAGDRRWFRARARAPEPEPIERLAANLRRLRAEVENMENRPGFPAKNLRLQALRGAYTDALNTACRRLQVGPPGTSPPGGERGRQAEIYRVEAELRQRGLDVREPAAH